ncbi:MAG TPA: hypothetical protein PKD54_14935 [Pirellulaceae bacterium]|nr:hypothetical protein [Pirellulaceae bacterium]
MFQYLAMAFMCMQTQLPVQDVGMFTKALWFLQAYGTDDCTSASMDQHVKSVLATALAKNRELSWDSLQGLIQRDVFERFAGKDLQLSNTELNHALKLVEPAARNRLLPELRRHADYLTTSFDMIDPGHYESMDQLSDWIAQNWHEGATLQVVTTCTGNSRRSILSAAMGNLSAAYYGFDNLRFYSGGTIPSAFNERTVATLKEIGFQIEATGEEAQRGPLQLPNPIYFVQWGQGFEAHEFSKHFADKSNPQSNFAVILVCTEAETECPFVSGATLRVSMTFLDPKTYDEGAFESRKYAERRDDIGRVFLAVMAKARQKIQNRQSLETLQPFRK